MIPGAVNPQKVDEQLLNPYKEEYQHIRTEILQYLNNYQAVRNMMYVSTLTCSGLAIGNDITNPYLYLLPPYSDSAVLFNSYEFWERVAIDSTYLRVFHEQEYNSFKWETRHMNLYKYTPKLITKINVQHFPYLACSVATLGLFWYFTYKTQDVPTYIFGGIISLLCIILYAVKHKVDSAYIMDGWEKVKKAEKSNSNMCNSCSK